MTQNPTNKKLLLKKETIAELNNEKMNEVKGGTNTTIYVTSYLLGCDLT